MPPEICLLSPSSGSSILPTTQDSGAAPNPWWRTLSMPELRWQGRFKALLPVSDIALGATEACYKAIRKDSDLCAALSQGVLTGAGGSFNSNHCQQTENRGA